MLTPAMRRLRLRVPISAPNRLSSRPVPPPVAHQGLPVPPVQIQIVIFAVISNLEVLYFTYLYALFGFSLLLSLVFFDLLCEVANR